MKKAFIWIGVILLSPILLFLALTFLLYLPPVQNWAVDKVATIASEEAGMKISVGQVGLRFPLDLTIEDVDAVHQQGDTIAHIGRMVADVELWPLLENKVVVNELTLEQAQVNTLDFISNLQVSGRIGRLTAHSKGIDLGKGTVELNNAQLSDADVTVMLSDTAAVDTTKSELPWLINVDSLSVSRTRVEIHMPGDSMQIMAYMGQLAAHTGSIDLANGIYAVRSFDWSEGQLTYDRPYEAPRPGTLDFNHLALSGIRVGLDSIYYSAPSLSLKIRETAMREQSGLEITRLSGGVLLDSASIQLPSLSMATPYSNIYTRARADFSIMDSVSPGQLNVMLDAQLGKQDLMLFMTDAPQSMKTRWPDWPLSIKGSIDGNMQQARIGQLDITLPTAFQASASGTVANLTNTDHLLAQLDLEAKAYNTGFLNPLLGPSAGKYQLPNGISLTGKAEARNGLYTADMTLRDGGGLLKAKGWLNQKAMSYQTSVQATNLNLHHFMPKDSLYHLSATLAAKGRGTDMLKPSTWLEAEAHVAHLQYGSMALDSLDLTAKLHEGEAHATMSGHNRLLDGIIDATAELGKEQLEATVMANIQELNIQALQMAEDPLSIGLCGHIDLKSDLNETHSLSATLGECYIRDSLNTFYPQDITLRALTRADTTFMRLQSGDLVMKADASGGYKVLFNQIAMLTDTLANQYQERIIDQNSIKRNLPTMRLYLTSGRDNTVTRFLHSSAKIDFKSMLVDMTASPTQGINGDARIYSLNVDSTRIDTIRLHLKDTDRGLTYQGEVTNNRRNPQFVFRALLDGKIHEKGALAGLRFYDDKGKLGLRIGMTADMMGDGLQFHLMPERPTIGYREFTLNKDNVLILHKNLRLEANVDLTADDGTGIRVYSESADSTMLQDLTISLDRFDLEKLTSSIPYMPRIEGVLDGDYHLVMDTKKQISVASDMQIANLTYEKNPIGNLSTEFVYLLRADETHSVEGRLMLDEREIGTLRGDYKNEGTGYLNADLTLERFPMSIINGFVPDQLLGFEGYANGEMKVVGALDKPKVDGKTVLDSAYLVSKPYGVRLRFNDSPINIVNSKLMLDDFAMYADNDNSLSITGNLDFHDTNRMTIDMRMRAQNFQLINSKQTKNSIAYGKAFVNFFARLNGRLDQLSMRGRLDVLGTTDLTYLLLDSPLSTDNQLDELVKFTDFSDSTQTVVEKPKPAGLDVSMSINIDQGAHVLCGLNADLSNYVDLLGGGELRMNYTNEGISMTGRYTVSSGEMKYSLPVIPLKTFTIQDGSYVEFTGNPTNPRLNLTATERTKATVSDQGQQSRSVVFDCGVVITKTLQDMGLEFIINAPEDMAISNDLNAMTTEERGKLAVTMLTTGMYLADGNTSGFSMNSALSSFLQSEINNITGNALKTLDLSVGLDNTTDAAGQMHTDYSFKFAKRFWNNRLKVQIGGKVSTGNEVEGQQQSFFDNVTMEYRLTPTSNQYVKLFYKQNVYDWLEGYTKQYGGGYIWKRKLESFWDIFKLWGSEKPSAMMPATMPRRERTDSIKPKNNEAQ